MQRYMAAAREVRPTLIKRYVRSRSCDTRTGTTPWSSSSKPERENAAFTVIDSHTDADVTRVLLPASLKVCPWPTGYP